MTRRSLIWTVAALASLVALVAAGGGATLAARQGDSTGGPAGARAEQAVGTHQGFAAGVVTPAAAGLAAPGPPSFYFHGQPPSDDPTKASGPPYTATFDATAPTGAVPVQQTATGVANPDAVANPLTAFWDSSDPSVTRTWDDVLEFRWYWSSSNATAIAQGADVVITVFADPDFSTGEAKVIAEQGATFTGLSPSPSLQVNRITVRGTVAKEMLVQVSPASPSTGEGLTASYNSTDFPSGFAAVAAAPAPGADAPVVTFANDNAPTFAPATLASAHFMAGEPQTTMERPIPGSPAPPGVDPNRIFVDWPLSSRSNTGQLSRSVDGGQSFRLLIDPTCAARQRPNCMTGGGGDTEEAVNPLTGDLFFADQEVAAQESMSSSTDHGDTFPVARQFPLTSPATGVDRQWLSAAPTDVDTTVGKLSGFLSYHVPEAGEYVVGIDANGMIFPPPAPQISGVVQSGQLRVDLSNGPGHGWIYQPYNSGGFEVATTNMSTYLDPTAWKTTRVGSTTPSIFTWLSLDDHGNAYATWVTNGVVMYSYSQIDDPANNPTLTPPGRPGTKWSAPVQISLPSVTSTIFNQSIAGAPGKVAVAYTGTSDFSGISDGPNNADGSNNNYPNARWHTYVAMIDNGLAAPGTPMTVRTGQVDHRIVHTGNVCTSGTACAATIPAKDRSLLDLLDVGVDQDGRVGVVFNDNNSALQTPSDPTTPRESPFIHFAKESTGPSLLGNTSVTALAPPTEPAGDAIWPNQLYQTPPKPNLDSLDATGLPQLTVEGGNVVARLPLADVTPARMQADLATYNASGLNAPTGAQRLQYVVRFSTNNNAPVNGLAGDVFFLSMDTPADGTATYRGFGGKLDANDAIINPASNAIVASGYHKDFDATVTVDGAAKQLVISAPKTAFGAGFGVGTPLYSVTGFTMAGPSEANETLYTNINRTVDATPPLDLVLAAPSSSPSAPTAALTASPTSGAAPVAVILDSSGSTPGTAPIVSRTYDFGDGTPAVTTTADRVTHVYDKGGVFTATVTVRDPNGLSASAPATVTLRTAPVAALVAAPKAGNAPLDVTLDATASQPGSNQSGGAATITNYRWRFGDGATATTTTPTVHHTYTSSGAYPVDVLVTNSNGDVSRSTSVTVTVLSGYWMVAADGGIFSHGASFFGSMGDKHLNKPIVGMAATPSRHGYYMVATDGGIFAFGDATFFGSMGDKHLNKPIVAMTTTPSGRGYWLVASDGGLFAFGDAVFAGSMGSQHLNKPIIGIASTPTGKGYWMVATDGGIFAFGDARFAGSQGGSPLNQPIVGMAPTPTGAGYWMVASDGGLFSFGDAVFIGSMGGTPLAKPMVGMAATPTGKGYWMDASDGGIFAFGDAPFNGSEGARKLNSPVVGMAAS